MIRGTVKVKYNFGSVKKNQQNQNKKTEPNPTNCYL